MTNLSEDRKASVKDFLIHFAKKIDDNLSENGNKKYLDEIETHENARCEFINKYRTIPLGCESFFAILRKWNSYTPSLPTTSKTQLNQFSIGGGYYLYIQGKDNTLDPGYGLVIDPGYNFIHNFGQAGFCLDDIDGILITHAHNDHTNDFESILSLLYQRNDKFIVDKVSKKVDLFLNVGSFKKFSNYLDLTKKKAEPLNYIGKVTVMSPGQVIKVPERDLDFEIYTLYTNHNEIVTNDYSLGLCFKVLNRNILLTGDTGWRFDTVSNNINFLEKAEYDIENIDVLIPHIGSIKKTEFDIATKLDIQESFYKSHLGLLGTICAIEQWKPKLCIISEFGEELIGIREQLVDELGIVCKSVDKDMVCLPGDIGLFVLLSSKKTICYVTKNLVEWDLIGYKDITDGSVNSMKYYKPDAISEVAEKEKLLSATTIVNGINIIRNYYSNKILSDYEIKLDSLENIIKQIAIADISDPDPTEKEKKHRYVVGRLMFLSCADNGCNAIQAAVSSGNSNSLVTDVLKNNFKISNDKIDKLLIKNDDGEVPACQQ